MKTDLYTKIVLTVIALALTINLAKEFDFISTAQANTAVANPSPLPTSIESTVVDINLKSIGGVPITNYQYGYQKENPYFEELNLYRGIPIRIESNSDYLNTFPVKIVRNEDK